MSAPSSPLPLPKVSVRNIRNLMAGESCFVTAKSPTQVSAEFSRTPGKFQQQQVFVIHCRTAECQKMFLVTRIS